jgi:hypothetical protein
MTNPIPKFWICGVASWRSKNVIKIRADKTDKIPPAPQEKLFSEHLSPRMWGF